MRTVGRQESVVSDSELRGHRRQPRVRRPELEVPNKSGGEEVRIDPANTAPVQAPITHELDDIGVRHDGCLVHSLVVGQQLLAAALVTDKELAEDEVVAAHFVTTQEPVQFTGVWRSIGQEPNPDRRINQDDHADA